jgi:hypothetical protein
VSAILLGGVDIVWQIVTQQPLWSRIGIGFLVWGLIGAGLPEAYRWIKQRENSSHPTAPETEPESATLNPREAGRTQEGPNASAELLLRRQQHLARLQAVLRKDATNLLEVARRLGGWEGQVADTSQASYQADFDSFWRPEVLSDDLKNHYKEYYEEKEMLRQRAKTHDKEFQDTLNLAVKLVTPTNLPEQIRTKVAIAYLDKCRGKGPGMRLEMSPGHFSYSYHGGSISKAGPDLRPPEDIIAVLKAFESFQPDAELVNRCTSLNQRANDTIEKAKQLSDKALRLAERAYLDGTCEYLGDRH